MRFTINGCSIDTGSYEIRRNGVVVPIEPQVFDLLIYLLERRDRVITKDEIIEHIWNGRCVSDAALSSRIKAVRQAIGDDGASQTCIRTIHRRGFRVVAPVTQEGAPATSSAPRDSAIEPDQATTAISPAGETMAHRMAHRILAVIRTHASAMIAGVAVLSGAAFWYALSPGASLRLSH